MQFSYAETNMVLDPSSVHSFGRGLTPSYSTNQQTLASEVEVNAS